MCEKETIFVYFLPRLSWRWMSILMSSKLEAKWRDHNNSSLDEPPMCSCFGFNDNNNQSSPVDNSGRGKMVAGCFSYGKKVMTYVAWPFTILYKMIILQYHEIFSGWQHHQPCRDTLVLSVWKKSHDIIILSFCNIVKGQAKCT